MQRLDMLNLHGQRGSHSGEYMPVGKGTEHTLVATRVMRGHYT